MSEKESKWIGFTSDNIESLPPEQRDAARKALADYQAQEPLAEVTVRVFRLEKGGSEVRFKTQVPDGTDRPDWYSKVAQVVIGEVTEASKRFGSPGRPKK